MKIKLSLTFSFLIAILLSGCYWNEQVNPDQAAVNMDGGEITKCLAPGIHSDGGWYADLVKFSVGTLTFSVEDPEVLTSDNQPVGIKITIQARRTSECEQVKNLLTNWPGLVSDETLVTTVGATAREGIKNGTRGFTLGTLLDDRNGLAQKISDALEEDAVKYSVTIVNVTVENISVDPAYLEQLKLKANYTAQVDAELKRQELIKQQAANASLEQEQRNQVLAAQLEAEKAQTAVGLEIASRAGKVTAAQNQVYLDNAAAFELERLRLLQGILGDKAAFYFIPQGTNISLFLGLQGQPIPVEPSNTPDGQPH